MLHRMQKWKYNMTEPVSEFKSKSGLRRILPAMGYALAGLKAAWKHEHAFRQELVFVVIGSVIALSLSISSFQKLFLIGVLVFVLIVELFNSAIEAIVDRVSLERHPLSKNAKDMGSAAQFVALSMIALVWAVILL